MASKKTTTKTTSKRKPAPTTREQKVLDTAKTDLAEADKVVAAARTKRNRVIVALRKKGMTHKAIGEAAGIEHGTVSDIVKRNAPELISPRK